MTKKNVLQIVEKAGGEGVVYKNIDLRKIPYGESVELVMLYNTPITGEGKYGTWYLYSFLYNDTQ